MSVRGGGATGPSAPARLLAIGAAVAFMVAVISLLVTLPWRERAREFPETGLPAAADQPIATEALVFRIRWGDLAAAPEAEPRREAQPRTFDLYQTLRAYPGAPPRIPHGLTDEEFRLSLCSSCHERGGYVPRFGGYAPVTPHPELRDCLQCHAANAMTVGLALPDRPVGLPCTQCHVDPGRPPPSLVSLDWVPLRWPDRDQRAMPGSPPAIPHDLQWRGNCLACHAGPGAVRGLRTAHPERVNCRQCHVPAAQGQQLFTRTGGDAR